MTLEWPPDARISPEARREIEAEHQRRLAERGALSLQERKLAEVERRLAVAERALRRVHDFVLKRRSDGDFQPSDMLLALVLEAADVIFDEEFERRSVMRYCGTWDATKAYPAGTLITDDGGAWVAIIKAAAGDRPGKAPCWRLAAKGSTKEPTLK